jgi:hypothetical protein
MMKAPLIVSVGMPRAGSGWHYNLLHDLVVLGGGKDARQIRKRFLLGSILTEVNCNIGAFTTKRLLPVMVPAYLGTTYTIKAHAGPSPLLLRLIKSGAVKPTYIYRDPRDALLSAYEYGERKREAGRGGAFSELDTIEVAIEFMGEYVRISESWLAIESALHTRYEDLLQNYTTEANRMLAFLNLDSDQPGIHALVEKYHPQQGRGDQVGTHFVKGKIGRYQEKLTPDQQRLCLDAFGPYLAKMGYPLH